MEGSEKEEEGKQLVNELAIQWKKMQEIIYGKGMDKKTGYNYNCWTCVDNFLWANTFYTKIFLMKQILISQQSLGETQ